MNKKPYHEVVANKLIEQLKQGTAPWQRSCEPGQPHAVMPINPVTGKRYKGMNALQLMAENHTDQRWMTYKQAESAGAQVRRGEKGTSIQYWAFTEEKIKTDEQGKPMFDVEGQVLKTVLRLERPRVFYATVFNAAQMDGLPEHVLQKAKWNSIERAEQILQASGATIHHGENNRAFYRPSTDSIHLPFKSQFASAGHYFSTALHELGHWSGAASRLDRDLTHAFGSEGYAREELRAEIASMMLGDELGIGHDSSQHAAYVSSWISVLENDPLELFRSAADAEKIQHFVLLFEHTLEQEQTQMNATRQEEHLTVFNENPRTIHEGIAMLNAAQSETLPVEQAITTEKIWLDIPFKQKDIAKEQAGTLPNGKKAIAWDKATSRWFAQAGADLEKLKPWLVNPEQRLHADILELPSRAHLAVEKTWLAVPYAQREAVKQLAGKLSDGSKAVEWDRAEKCWFAHAGADLDTLKPWLADEQLARQEPALGPEQEFSDLLKSVGCHVTGDHPVMDGQKHRISIEGDKQNEKSGFYVGHVDGHPAGYIKNNRTGIEVKWRSKGYSLSPDQKAAMQAELAVKQETRSVEQASNQEKAAIRVGKKLAELIPIVTPTPYLQAKGIESHHGIFTDKNNQITCIPTTDENGKLWTIQYIQEDGTKRFAKNSRKEGCFHAIGGLDAIATAPVIVISEGYATAASVSEALGFPTVAAFDAGNLEAVARALHDKFPDKPVLIAGDDDQHLEATQGINPGKTKAIKAARAVNGTAIFPIFAPGEQARNPKGFSDFNDLANKSVLGQEGVKRQIHSVVENIKNLRQGNDARLESVVLNDVEPSRVQPTPHKGQRMKKFA